MNRTIVFTAALLACAPVLASAQIVAHGVRTQQALVSGDSLQRTADQRWDAVFAADNAYMHALTDAVQAEIAARRAHGGDTTELATELARLRNSPLSFSMQYLQLQSQMQHENQSYTAISNIMKTKHDTVQNSISNVR